MNNIYVMYIVLCESIISILLLFKFLFKSTSEQEKNRRAKSMDEKILWTTEMKRQYAFHDKVHSSKYKTR